MRRSQLLAQYPAPKRISKLKWYIVFTCRLLGRRACCSLILTEFPVACRPTEKLKALNRNPVLATLVAEAYREPAGEYRNRSAIEAPGVVAEGTVSPI